MSEHFCTCKVKGCDKHPLNHSEGCDPCIRKNLKSGEIPACFWLKISDDLSGYKSYTFEDFSGFYHKHKEEYLAKKAEAEKESL